MACVLEAVVTGVVVAAELRRLESIAGVVVEASREEMLGVVVETEMSGVEVAAVVVEVSEEETSGVVVAETSGVDVEVFVETDGVVVAFDVLFELELEVFELVLFETIEVASVDVAAAVGATV